MEIKYYAFLLIFTLPATCKRDFYDFFKPLTSDVLDLGSFKMHLTDKRCMKCPRVYFPICANNNFTYTNECKIICANNILKDVNERRIRYNRPPLPKIKKFRIGRCDLFDW